MGNPAPRDVDFFDIVSMLRRQFLVILLLLFAGIVAASYKYSVTPNKFASNASLSITSRASGAMLSGSRDELTDDFHIASVLPTLVAFLTGDDVLTAAWNALGDDPAKRKHIRMFSFDDGVIAGRGALRSTLSVRVGSDASGDTKKANVISVTCVAPTAIEARVILQEVVDQYKIYMANRHTEQAKSANQALEQGRIDMEKGIEAANEEMRRYIQTSAHSFIGDEANNPLLTRLQDMETKLVDIDYQLLKYENRLNIVESTIAGRALETIPDDEIIGMLGSSDEEDQLVSTISALAQGGSQDDIKTNALIHTAVNMEMNDTTQIEMEIARLLSDGVGEDNPKVRGLRERLRVLQLAKSEKAGMNGEIATLHKVGIFTYPQLLATYIKVLQGRIEEVKKQREKMEGFIADQDERVRDITEYRQTLESMRFAIDAQKNTFIELKKRLDELALIGSYGGYQVEILDPPTTPRRPFSPNLYLYLLVGALCGITAGIGLAFLLDNSDTTFRTPAEIEAVTGLNILAQFPGFVSTGKGIPKATTGPGVPVPGLITYHLPNSPQCEVFSGLRTRLFLNQNGDNIQVLQGTSPHPGDGKTMFICNMAIKTADADKNVLLIDGDIRKPDIHKWFNLPNKSGFSDLLAGKATYEEVVKKTAVENLTVITAGVRPSNPAELLSSPILEDFISRMRTIYDVILIDSSPVNYVADPCIVASKVDGIIYNMRIRRHGRPAVVQGVRALADVGANIIGCTVNCYEKHRFYNEFAVSKHPRYGSYGSYGGYGTGYGGGYGGGYGYGSGYGYGGGYGYGYGSYGKKYGSRGYGERAPKPHGNEPSADSVAQPPTQSNQGEERRSA